MSARDLITGIRRHLGLLALALLLGGAVAQLITMLLPRTYESKTAVFVSVSQAVQRLDQAYQGTLFTQQQVRSYADLATTPKVTEPVIKELHLRMRPDTLAKRLSVEVPVDTVLLNITAHDRSPAMAARIANGVARNLVNAVAELEAPGPGRQAAVQIHVVRTAMVPIRPSTPKPALNIGIGLALGAIAGVGAGVLKDALNTRIDDSADVTDVAEKPILGDIPYEGAARKSPLVHDTSPFGPRSEAFRKLRTNLQFVGIDEPPRTILVTSPRTGDGKSSTALNLAFSLADDGARVVVVDADLRRPSIASSLGLIEGAGLTSVLSGQASISEVMQRATRRSAIDVVTSGPIPPNPSELLGARKMRLTLQELRSEADYVIVDSPPLLPVTDAAVIAPGTDGVVLVVRTGKTKRDELRGALDSLGSVNATTLGVITNMTKTGGHDRYRYRYYVDARDHTGTVDAKASKRVKVT